MGKNQEEREREKKIMTQLAFDPRLPMTKNQRHRYELKKKSKPRPREIFNVNKIIQQKEQRLIKARERLEQQKNRKPGKED